MSEYESIQECSPSKAGRKKARRMENCAELYEKIKELMDKER